MHWTHLVGWSARELVACKVISEPTKSSVPTAGATYGHHAFIALLYISLISSSIDAKRCGMFTRNRR